MAMASKPDLPPLTRADRKWHRFCRDLDIAAAHRIAAAKRSRRELTPRVSNNGCRFVARFIAGETVLCAHNGCGTCSLNPKEAPC